METMKKYYGDIPKGKDNEISKADLMRRWNMSERMVRRIIQELRAADFADNYVIISSSSGKGYYKSDRLDEIAAFKKEVTNRGRHTFLPLRKVNRILAGSMPLVNNLQEIRKAKGITNTEAVDYVRRVDPNFDKSILSKIENGRCGPTNQQLAMLAELYESTPEELAGLIIA